MPTEWQIARTTSASCAAIRIPTILPRKSYTYPAASQSSAPHYVEGGTHRIRQRSGRAKLTSPKASYPTPRDSTRVRQSLRQNVLQALSPHESPPRRRPHQQQPRQHRQSAGCQCHMQHIRQWSYSDSCPSAEPNVLSTRNTGRSFRRSFAANSMHLRKTVPTPHPPRRSEPQLQ